MLKYFLFDVDGTLFELKEPLFVTYQREIERVGGVVSGDLASHIYEVWKSLQPHYLNVEGGFVTTKAQEREFWLKFATTVVTPFVKPELIEDATNALYNFYATKQSRKLIDGVTAVLSAIKAKGFNIGVYTNNDERTHELLESFNLTQFLSNAFTAGDIGYKKPSPNGFIVISERLNIPTDSILMIGDDYERDCLSAMKAGCRAAFLNIKNTYVRDERILHLTSLHDVISYIND